VDIEKIKNKLKNLPQYKNISEEELTKKAKEKFEKDDMLSKLTFCRDDEERKFASTLLESYLGECSFENSAERDTLRQLIDLEILVERIKSVLKTEYDKANPSIPLQMVEQLTNLNGQILELKEKLGLSRTDKENVDFIKLWDSLKKKALKFYEENKGCNTFKCPYCQNLFHLLYDKRDYKEIKAIWFRGTHLYNERLMKLYHVGKITEDEVAEVLGVSKFYVPILYNDIYLKELKESKIC